MVEPQPSPPDVPGNRPSPLVLAAIAAGGLAVFGVFALLLPSLIGGGSPSTPPVHNAAPPGGVTAAPTQDGPSAAGSPAPTPSAAPPSATATTVPATVGNARFEQQVVAFINNERRRGHCPALRVDGKLRAAARSHSADMATNNFVGQTGTDGSSAIDRMQKAGYPQGLSELVARGGDSPQAVVRSWTRDRADRAQLLDCDARAIGVGVAFRGRTAYWTADFGRARSGDHRPAGRLVGPGVDRVPTLLPLRAHPLARPHAWDVIAAHGSAFTVVVDVADGPGTGRDPAYTAAMSRLAGAGVGLLGRVDLGYGTRPLTDVIADVDRWAGYPVHGVYFDRAPATPYAVGTVARAVKAARRAELLEVVLNPGVVPDPIYRDLDLPMCVFDGTWLEYRHWAPDGARPGDGHLVHDVPPWDLDQAAQLLRERGAGFGVVTDLGPPDPFADLPAWCGPAKGERRLAVDVATSGK